MPIVATIAAAVGRFLLELGRYVLMQVSLQVVMSFISRVWTRQPATEGI